jgi:4-hydroxybenzoate polyprenyltransferase
MLDRQVLELVLISLLAVLGTGLAWALDHQLFAAAFAGAAVVAGYAARSLAGKR